MPRRVLATLAFAVAAVSVQAQWLGYMDKRVPRNADGTPNLAAPPPRAADGKVDLSGVWQPAIDPGEVKGGIEGMGTPKYMVNVMRDFKGAVPFHPWAERLFKERQANKLRDNPNLRCLPVGVPRLVAYTHPYKIVQTPGLVLILYESQTLFRQIFTDGRAVPKDAEPTWLGYSIGRWDGDALVVETSGFNDQTWLDSLGHPHSDAMRVTERFTRQDVGRMNIEVVIDDPKAYKQPIRYLQPQQLLPDDDLIEYVCNENAKPVGPG